MCSLRLSGALLAIVVTCSVSADTWARSSVSAAKVQRLLDDLRQGPQSRRDRAAQRLYHLQHPRGNAGVVAMASNPNPHTRAVGVWALSVVRPPSAGRIVRQRLDDPNPAVRLAATQAAGTIKLARAASQLRRLLRDEDRFVQLAAVRALAALGAKGVPGLKRALSTGTPEQRLLAVRALDELPGRQSRGLLRRAAHRGPIQVRLLAAQALDRRGDRAGTSVLGRLALHAADKGIRLQAIAMLAQSEQSTRHQPLRRLLRDKDPQIRRAAADALASNPHSAPRDSKNPRSNEKPANLSTTTAK